MYAETVPMRVLMTIPGLLSKL